MGKHEKSHLERIRRQDGGNWYTSAELKLDGWLCPALYKYFKTAPQKLYIKVLPNQAPRTRNQEPVNMTSPKKLLGYDDAGFVYIRTISNARLFKSGFVRLQVEFL